MASSQRPGGFSSDDDDDSYYFGGISDEEKDGKVTAEPFKPQIENSVYIAVVSSDLETLREKLDEGFDVDAVLLDQWNALLLATSSGNVEVVKELLRRGANPHVTREGKTTLMFACSCPATTSSPKRVAEIVEQLILHLVDVNAKDSDERTALMLACGQGNVEASAHLIPLSNPSDFDSQQWTALFYAVVVGRSPELVAHLLENGWDPKAQDCRGRTADSYTRNKKILKLFHGTPKEEAPVEYYNFSDIFNENKRDPLFFSDVRSLLYSMQCSNLVDLFFKNNVDLYTFLTITEEQLEAIGVNSYDRKSIMINLGRFHAYNFSIFSILSETPANAADVINSIGSTFRHLVIMRAGLTILSRHPEWLMTKNENLKELIEVTVLNIERFYTFVCLLSTQCSEVDALNRKLSPDLITNSTLKTRKRKRAIKKILVWSVSVISVFVLCGLCVRQYRFRFPKLKIGSSYLFEYFVQGEA